jgi:hypothetical protein
VNNTFLTYLELPIGIAAAVLISITQIIYIRDVYLKKVQPSVLSWVGWTLLMGTGIVSQIIEEGWDWSHCGILFATLGCGLISLTSLLSKNFVLAKKDWGFLVIGLVCLVIYLVSNDVWITTIFAILADFIIGVPTLKKAFRDPVSEKSNAWFFSLATWSLTLIISFHHGLIYSLFPIYLFLYVVTLLFLIYRKKETQTT